MLDAVGTLLKGSERFLEILVLLVTLSKFHSEFQSLNVVQFFLWTVEDSSGTCSLRLRRRETISTASLP